MQLAQVFRIAAAVVSWSITSRERRAMLSRSLQSCFISCSVNPAANILPDADAQVQMQPVLAFGILQPD